MQQNLVCRGCLSVEGKFTNVHEFSTAHAYENLIGIPLQPSDTLTQHLCSFCVHTLHKFAEFKARCQKVLEVLQHAQFQGCVITKEYSHSLIASCPELKPRYIRSNILTLDFFDSSKSENNSKEESRSDPVHSTEPSFNFDIDVQIDKEERLSDNEIEDTDVANEDLIEPKHENNENDLEITPCEIFADDFNNVLNKNKVKVKKVTKAPKRTRKQVKNKRKVGKKSKKASKSDKEIVTDYAKSAGFHIAFLSNTEQIQEVEEKKNEVVTNGHNCRQCGKFFQELNTLDRHKKNYHIFKPDSFMCDICSCVFKNKRTLRAHVTGHSWVFTCQSCNFKTKQRSVLRKHKYYHEGKMFTCTYCGKIFEKHASYFSHVRLQHASKLAWCELCGEFFNSEKGVDSHKKLTHNMVEEFPNACRNCDKRFKSESALERHTIVKGCTQSSCAQCGDSFHNDDLLKYHLVQRHIDNAVSLAFDCSHCTVRFHNEAALVRHLCGAAVVCNQCGDNFHSPQLLTDHVALKHDIFKCEECGKQFTNATYFKRHYSLSHTGKARRPLGRPREFEDIGRNRQGKEKQYPMRTKVRKWRVVGEGDLMVEKLAADGRPLANTNKAGFVMCEVCGKYIKNSTELRYHHKAYHSGETLFTCSHCSKGFKRKDLLKVHERVHTGERPYKCPECPKAFKTYQACTRHKLVHSGERSHVCSMCDKTFQLSTSVKWHIKTAHLNMPWPARNKNHKRKLD